MRLFKLTLPVRPTNRIVAGLVLGIIVVVIWVVLIFFLIRFVHPKIEFPSGGISI